MAGSLRKEGSTWYYVLEHTENGKRKQIKRRGFKTKKEAKKALVEASNAINKGIYFEPSKMLYKDYLHEWMIDKQHSIGSQTVKANMSYINDHVIPSTGDIPLDKLNAFDIQR